MDSLTKDVVRIFNQTRGMERAEEGAAQSMVYRVAKRLFDIAALLAVFLLLAFLIWTFAAAVKYIRECVCLTRCSRKID